MTAEQQNLNGTDPKQDGDKKKEKVLVRSTLERYNVDFFELTVDQIPKKNMASINCGHKTEHKMVGMDTMLDTGSTICSVTPKHAKHLTATLGWIATKGTKFSVENGGEKNEIFSGDYIRMPIQRPNSSGYVAIRWYISPHNEVPYPMIMGMRDMSRIGYGLHLNVGDGMIIFENSAESKLDQKEALQTNSDIIAKMESAADIFGTANLDYAVHTTKQTAFVQSCKQQRLSQKTDESELKDNTDEIEQVETKTDDLDDVEEADDDEDGIRGKIEPPKGLINQLYIH